jgi:hypothetical protein
MLASLLRSAPNMTETRVSRVGLHAEIGMSCANGDCVVSSGAIVTLKTVMERGLRAAHRELTRNTAARSVPTQ